MFSFHQSKEYNFKEIKHDLKKIDFSDGTCLIDLTLHDIILDDELVIKWDVVNANQEIIELEHIIEVLASKYKFGMSNISLDFPYLPYAITTESRCNRGWANLANSIFANAIRKVQLVINIGNQLDRDKK